MQMDINKTVYPFYVPEIMPCVHGRRKGGWQGQGPQDFEMRHFPVTFLAKKVELLISSR